MSVRYGIILSNPEFFNTLIEDSNLAFKCTALSCRYLTFKNCPRIGESIQYPLLSLLDEGTRYWLHGHIVLEVIDIIHNPESVIDDCVKPTNESDILLVLKAKLVNSTY
jgi:hypothetical protein